jgi:putative ABC transport system permease protein
MVCYWRMAARNLLQARRRTLALAAALATVSMCMVLLMTLSQGINDNLVRASTLLITGHVNIGGFYKTRPSNAATVVTPSAPLKRLAQEALPDVKWIIDRSRGWGKLTSPSGSIEAMLWGIDVEQEAELLSFMQLAAEHEYVEGGSDVVRGDIHKLSQPHTALLFAAQAKRLGVQVGDNLTISAETIVGQQNTD